MIQVMICGILGNMGAKVMEACFADQDIAIVAGIDQEDGVLANIPIYKSFSDCAQKADVLIDFSNPALAPAIVDYCAQTKTALVMCTTGHSEKEVALLRGLSEIVPVFFSANMSLGIALLKALAQKATAALHSDFDIEIVERHHNRKLDAPSGTAMMLGKAINDVVGGQYEFIYNRHDVRKKRDKKEIGMHAIRGGTIVGDHEILFAGNDENITLSHSASSRTVFAVGAINAARFIVKQQPGLYDMDSLMKSVL